MAPIRPPTDEAMAALPRGAILCVVNVTGCVRFPHELAPPDEYGDFEQGRFGILMTMHKKLNPSIICRGHQGIWDWDERGKL